MEFEVRAVGGMESCFVSLPLSLIQTLENTRGGFLPPVLALELRARSGGGCWNVGWSGSASKTAAIEVDQLLAECISLPDHTRVEIKAIANLPKADFVNIEPSSEDDWEILELNSELAEEAILKQVGVVYEGMKFPLWLHGHVKVELVVVSTSLRESVVQLVPGTEVVVEPKRRKNEVLTHQSVQKQNSRKELRMKALLRVQAEKRKYVHKIEFKDIDVLVFLSYVAFIHPETAKKFSLENLQLATVIPKLWLKDISQNGNAISERRGDNHLNIQGNSGLPTTSKVKLRHAVVHIIYSDAVAKGHVMLPQSLRHFIGSGLHSWVFIKKHFSSPKKDIFSMRVSPLRVNLVGNDKVNDDNRNTIESHTILKQEGMATNADTSTGGILDWSLQESSFSPLTYETLLNEDSNNVGIGIKLENKLLIKLWMIGQIGAIASQNGQMKVNSVVLTNETFLHLEIINHKFGKKKEELSLQGTNERENVGERKIEIFYLLRINYIDSSKCDVDASFEFDINVGSKNSDNLHDLELALGKLEVGDLLSFDSISESVFKRNFHLTASSLTWLKASISDVTDRLLILLSPESMNLFSAYDIPSPGHILIYGPPGSGKTTLARAVARHFEEHKEILAHIIFISCSKLALEKSLTVRQAISEYISEALSCSPSIVIFDDLDNIISFSSDEGSQPSSSATALVNYVIDILDEYGNRSQSSCGYGPVAFVASVQSLQNIPQSLSSSGRFDFHVQLVSPAVSERGQILKYEIEKRALLCPDDIVSEIAAKCDGYDAYDLEILVDRAVHAAVSRFLPSRVDKDTELVLQKEDFSQAMHEFVPIAMRGLTKAASEGGHSGWDDVGGLADIRNAIQEVRDLFSKAAAASPCLLFFDEFDSIAPKRGHDNTGVTDRVVNQLLTELDGVEALTGVFVFAATR